MIVLTLNATGITEHRARHRDRLLARLQGARLDRELCRGASADATVALALRAETLVTSAHRRDLAHSLQHVIALADRPASPMTNARVCRPHVHAAHNELQALGDRLCAAGPVSAHGIAQVTAILTDGSGPLYQHHSPHDLGAQLRHALDSLDQLTPTDG